MFCCAGCLRTWCWRLYTSAVRTHAPRRLSEPFGAFRCFVEAHWEHALEHLAFAQHLASMSQEATQGRAVLQAKRASRVWEVSQPFLVALHGAVSVFAEARRWEQAARAVLHTAADS